MIQLLVGISIVTIYVVIIYIYERRTSSLTCKILSYIFMAMLLQALGVFLQLSFKDSLGIDPIYFEYLIYIGKAFLPTLLIVFAIVYENPRANLKRVSWMFFIPVFIIAVVWTNGLHHMFITNYTGVHSGTVYGIMYYMYLVLAYMQVFPAILLIIRASIDKNTFISPQTILTLITLAIPIVPALIDVTSPMIMPHYIMVISYMLSSLVLSYSILKYNILNAVPIALKSVIDIMSDLFVVISPDGTIVDMNHSFLSKFNTVFNLRSNKTIYDIIKFEGIHDIKKLKNDIMDALDSGIMQVDEYHIVKNDFDKYFEVQVQPIKARTSKGFIAVLLVFRDVTEQRANIDMVIKKENLSVIGELAGGVAHEINTPISAIKSGLLMLRNTVKTKEEKQLIESMTNSADKISNLANSLKNQIRNLGNSSDTEFSLTELIQDLYILMHSDLMKNNIKLSINETSDIWLTGNSAKLTQVITNIIQNSMKAYGNKGGIIDVNIYKDKKDNNVIMIEDWAGGIPEEVQPYIFKKIIKVNEMPTTGVGLYLAYSVIKGNFGGEVKFETKKGKGTKFYIIIPNK